MTDPHHDAQVATHPINHQMAFGKDQPMGQPCNNLTNQGSFNAAHSSHVHMTLVRKVWKTRGVRRCGCHFPVRAHGLRQGSQVRSGSPSRDTQPGSPSSVLGGLQPRPSWVFQASQLVCTCAMDFQVHATLSCQIKGTPLIGSWGIHFQHQKLDHSHRFFLQASLDSWWYA